MQARRLVDLPEVAVLSEESSELGIEVAGLCVVEAGLFVPDVSSEGEAVGALTQFVWESEVAPGIEVVARDLVAVVVGEVDDGAQAVEGEVASALVGACE